MIGHPTAISTAVILAAGRGTRLAGELKDCPKGFLRLGGKPIIEESIDRLLAAGIEYNERNSVVHLSDRPPHPKLVSLAGRMGQKIVHIPISTVSSVKLGRIRRFHVLDSRERRDGADEYIW